MLSGAGGSLPRRAAVGVDGVTGARRVAQGRASVAADSNDDVLDHDSGRASGVYSGSLLLIDPPPGRPVPTMQVFEQSHRIGGRLL